MKKTLVVLWLLLLVGCGEKTADISNPLSYSKNNLIFNYPGNWTVSNDENLGGIHNLYLDTTGDGIAIVQVYDATDASDLETYTDSFSKSMSESLPVGKVVDLKQLTGSGIKDGEVHQTFAIEVMGQKVPHKRQFVIKKFDNKVCFLIFQIAIEDEANAIKGFDLIKNSISFKAK